MRPIWVVGQGEPVRAMSGVRDQGWGLEIVGVGVGSGESRELRCVRDRGWTVWGLGGTRSRVCKWGYWPTG